MEFSLATVLIFVTGALAGAVAALKVIAPRTKNTYDDKALKYAEDILVILPKPKDDVKTPEVKVVQG